jgi:hypothetical protein
MGRIVFLLGACIIVTGSFFTTLYVIDTYGEAETFVIGAPVVQEQKRPVVRTSQDRPVQLIATPPGSPIPLGVVEGALQNASSPTTVTGWAIDFEAKRPAGYVIVILDGRLIGWTVPNIARSDIAGAAGLGADYQQCGFAIPIASLRQDQVRRIKVYAVIGPWLGKELIYSPNVR